MSQLVAVPASSSNPTYLVLNGYDRNEYTNVSSDTTGSFSGNSHTLGFSALEGDARGTGIVFTYSAATGRYSNSTYGFLDQLSYTASTSTADITDLSLFGTSDAGIANPYASSGISLAQYDAAGYLDTLTVATEPGYHGTVPPQATPLSIAAMAQTFDGLSWNTEGCWILASTISAEAGASLPVQSAVDMAGAANGEWFIAYNGPAGSTGDWAASVRTGDMIGFITSAGTGHITTCVSGAGATAMLIDNITFVTPEGMIVNGADDGSPTDVTIQPAHPAPQEWQGAMDKSVVIFRLDTPVVATLVPTVDISAGEAVNLATIFSAADPAGKAVTSYQAYTTTATDWFTVNGTSVVATSASTAVTASSLSQITLNGGLPDVPDLVTVRASNGAYWGDWTTISTEALAGNQVSIHRFFNTSDGTHFFTASAAEAATTVATRPDLVSEGIGLKGYNQAGASSSSEAVFRFFDRVDGTHFYTASAHERDALVTTRSSEMAYEGIAFYEDEAPQAGDTAVFRFFDTVHGTHLFTQNASEKASILATRPDLVSEGIAFYAPS
ncbi:MAG: hypothetical protein ACRYG8_05245 [Janthinobacterium lividum]